MSILVENEYILVKKSSRIRRKKEVVALRLDPANNFPATYRPIDINHQTEICCEGARITFEEMLAFDRAKRRKRGSCYRYDLSLSGEMEVLGDTQRLIVKSINLINTKEDTPEA